MNDPRVNITAVKDYKAAKKFITAIEENKHKDQIIITIDDDVFYSSRLVETLVTHYKRLNANGKKAAVSIMGYRINQDKTWGAELHPKNWLSFSEFSYYFVRGFRIKKPYRVSITTGSGGVCFNSKWFQNVDVSNFSGAPANAPLLDDIWLNGVLAGLGVKRYVVPIDDSSSFLVKKSTGSIIDTVLKSTNGSTTLNYNEKRYEANNEMIAYFDKEFTKENIWYHLGGKTHPEYISYFYIAVIEPIKIFFQSLWISFHYHQAPHSL